MYACVLERGCILWLKINSQIWTVTGASVAVAAEKSTDDRARASAGMSYAAYMDDGQKGAGASSQECHDAVVWRAERVIGESRTVPLPRIPTRPHYLPLECVRAGCGDVQDALEG